MAFILDKEITTITHIIHPELRLTPELKRYLYNIIYQFLDKIREIVKELKIPVITSDVFIKLLNILINGELLKMSKKTIEKYENVDFTDHKLQIHKKIGKFFKAHDVQIEEQVVHDLTSVIDYILAEYIELAGNATRSNEKSTISVFYVVIAVNNDLELLDFELKIKSIHNHKQIQKNIDSLYEGLKDF